ncbi:MAG: hypothetical protein PHY59_06145 [Methanobacterium sp.]|nr:hypothetical protein [Methanobacterium sp.]
MHNPNIPRTANQVENYYRQTLPKATKKKYKTITDLTNYLNLQKKRNRHKNTKKTANPQQLDNPSQTQYIYVYSNNFIKYRDFLYVRK